MIFEYSLDEHKYKSVTISGSVYSDEDSIRHYLGQFRDYIDKLVITNGTCITIIIRKRGKDLDEPCNKCIFYERNWIYRNINELSLCQCDAWLGCTINGYYAIESSINNCNSNDRNVKLSSIHIKAIRDVICSNDVCIYKSDNCENNEPSCLLKMIIDNANKETNKYR